MPRFRRAPRRQARLRVPSQALRLRRGPTPPDHIVDDLERALRAELGLVTDAEDPPPPEEPTPASPWWAALAAALLGITRHARRGVTRALPPGEWRDRAALAPVVPSLNWAQRLTAKVWAALRRGLADALQTIAEAVMVEHTRVVGELSRAGGSRRYVWTSRRDGHVRQLHVELDGTVQRWDSPPLAGLPNFHGHPGEAAGPCRCVAFPILG